MGDLCHMHGITTLSQNKKGSMHYTGKFTNYYAFEGKDLVDIQTDIKTVVKKSL